jgi:hypothetical protein
VIRLIVLLNGYKTIPINIDGSFSHSCPHVLAALSKISAAINYVSAAEMAGSGNF